MLFFSSWCLGVFLCIIHLKKWAIIWEEFVPNAQVLFSLGFLPSSSSCIVSPECWLFFFFPPLFFLLYSTQEGCHFFSWDLLIYAIIWKMLSEKKARTNSSFLESLQNHSPSHSACIDCFTMTSNIIFFTYVVQPLWLYLAGELIQ